MFYINFPLFHGAGADLIDLDQTSQGQGIILREAQGAAYQFNFMEFCANENSGGSSQNQEEKYERRARAVEKIQQGGQIV